jgi:two-component system, chemotaxis family, chemotaxis protein CheY
VDVLAQILIVDDSSFSRAMMVRELTGLGIDADQILQVGSGAEALAKMNEQTFDLFILDIVMTGIDGITVLKEAKQRQPSAKIVMCSGSSAPELVKESVSLGIDGFIVKPYKAEDFIRVVCGTIPGLSAKCETSAPLHVKCHVCDSKMIEVNSLNTVSFYCPAGCMQIGPVVYALASQQHFDEDYARAHLGK